MNQAGQTKAKHRLMRSALVLMLCAVAFTRTTADVLKTGSTTQTGSLEGYDGRNFQFRDKNTGNVQGVSRMAVNEITLDKPRMAEVVIGNNARPENMLVRGYANGRFLLIRDGKELAATGMDVKSIKLAPAGEPAPAAAAEPTQQIADADINTLLARPGLAADQQMILETYKAAKQEYGTFQRESASLVSRMDSLTGNDRQAALNELRLRREKEQPLKRKMAASQQALLAAFPELLTGHAAPVGNMAEVNEAMPAATITMTLPKMAEHDVLIIDTGVFRQLGTLTETQSKALSDYDAAATTYQESSAEPLPGKLPALQQTLRSAQENLFKAFPNVRIVQQDM